MAWTSPNPSGGSTRQGGPANRRRRFRAWLASSRTKSPSTSNGTFAPHDDHAFRSVEMFLNIFAPMGAAADMSVPPDGETFRFERGDQWAKSGAVLGLVRNKYVRRPDHCCPPAMK